MKIELFFKLGIRVKKRIFIDTSYVIALVDERDQYHQEASKLADKYENCPAITTDLILLEIGNGLSRQFKEEAIEIIDGFLSSEEVSIINLTPQLFNQSLGLYRKFRDKKW
jgi:uncharacterized protein